MPLLLTACLHDDDANEREAVLTTTAARGETAPAAGHARVEVQCPAGDLVLSVQTVKAWPPEAPAPATPEEAVRRGVTELYPGLPPAAFRRSPRAQDAIEFAHERGGAKRVVVEVVKYGDGWIVERYQACNSVARDERRGAGNEP